MFHAYNNRYRSANIWETILKITGLENNIFEKQKQIVSAKMNPLVEILNRTASKIFQIRPDAYIRLHDFYREIKEACKKKGMGQVSEDTYEYETNEYIFKQLRITKVEEELLWPPIQCVSKNGVLELPKLDDERQAYLKGVGLIQHFPTQYSIYEREEFALQQIQNILNNFECPRRKRKLARLVSNGIGAGGEAEYNENNENNANQYDDELMELENSIS